MITLAIDTATEICSLAFTMNEQIIGACSLKIDRAHSEKLIPLIQNLSRHINLQLSDIGLIAVASGPGSFTGLRIGTASAKGLAHALNCPLVAVNSLDALAYQAAIKTGKICPLIKARKNEVYTTLYEKNSTNPLPVRLTDYQVLPIRDLKKWVPAGAYLLGNGTFHFQQELNQLFNDEIFILTNFYSLPNAVSTAILGWQKFQSDPRNELLTLEPFYIQDFQIKK